MDPRNDEQTELLRHIWNEMKALGQNLGGRIDNLGDTLGGRIDALTGRVDVLTGRVDVLTGRVDALEHSLGARIDLTNERLGAVEGAVRDLAAQQLMLGRVVKHSVDRHDNAIDDLRERLVRVETELSLRR
jgi:hypothetical protein